MQAVALAFLGGPPCCSEFPVTLRGACRDTNFDELLGLPGFSLVRCRPSAAPSSHRWEAGWESDDQCRPGQIRRREMRRQLLARKWRVAAISQLAPIAH